MSAEHGAELAVEAVVSGRDHQPALLRQEALVGHHLVDARSVGPRNLAGGLVGGHRHAHPVQRRLVERRTDDRSTPRARPLDQTRQDADHRPHARTEIDQRRTDPHGRTIAALARDAHDAPEGLHQRIVARLAGERTRLPEGVQVAIDQLRLRGRERLRAEAELVDDAGTHVLQHHVRAIEDQPAKGRNCGRVLEIDPKSLLAAIEGVEGGGLVLEEGRPAPGMVAAVGILDLQHVRSEIGQDQSGERSRHAVAELDDRQAFQRPRLRHPGSPFLSARQALWTPPSMLMIWPVM